VTDESGSYLISNLPTGPYRLEVSLQGFRNYVQTGLVLTVGATPTVNAALELGSLEETVTVEAAAPLVDVRSAGISSVVENERIVELPLQGRQVTDLLVLAGAAVQTAEATNRVMPGGVRISVAGGLPTGVGYSLDGATHNNPQENVNLPLPFPDALQEFRVATSGLSAQHGFHSAASVSAVTKSGTNRFSGNAFEFLRDHRLNATSPFARIGADGKRVDDGLKRNQFGGTLGGPIVRDKLFFFGAYQGTVLRQVPTSNIAFVPTAQMLAGDLTTFASPACNGGRQVALRAPYVNNRINPGLFSPAALNLAKRLPSTTDPCGQITYDVKSDRDEKQTLARIDFQAGAKHSFFGRYFVTRFTQPSGYTGGSDNLLKTSNQGTDAWSHSTTLGATTVLSSAVVNALRVAINTGDVDNYQTPFFSPKDIGANVYSYDPGYMVMTVTPGFSLYAANQARAAFLNETYQVADDLTLVRGNHQFAMGGHDGALDLNTDVGYQNYHGVKLSAQRRAAAGVSLNANYTLSRCTGTPQNPRFNQTSAGYLKPDDPSFDDGYCDQDRPHLATLTVGYETPDVANAALRAVASHWRFSGILNARAGGRLNILSGIDNAFTGIGNQRPNQVSDDFYGHSLLTYFNRAAFAQPAPGTLGDLPRNAVTGPNYWAVDLAMSKLISVSGAERLELRIEAFNLLNQFNWGDPVVNFNAGTFGRITTQAGAPRIIQFGIKYDL